MEVIWIITIIKRLSNFTHEVQQKFLADNAERRLMELSYNNGLINK